MPNPPIRSGRRLLVALVLAAAGTGAGAQVPDSCASPANTLELNACAEKVLKVKDVELNRAYQSLLESLKRTEPGDRTDYAAVKRELADAQRAWIKFRDSDCSAKYKYWEEGSIRGIKYLTCLTERTEQRTNELLRWADI